MTATQPSQKIVFIEKSSGQRAMMSEFFEENCYELVACATCDDILSVLENLDKPIDLFLCDIHLPNHMRYALSLKLRNQPRFDQIPVYYICPEVSHEPDGLNQVERYRSVLCDLNSPTRPLTLPDWKTLLFFPQFAFKSVRDTDADCFIVDFQDAVPLCAKQNARDKFKEAILGGVFQDRSVIIRINERALDDELRADLDTIVGLPGVYGVMPTMITEPYELDELDREFTRRERQANIPIGTYRFLPLIETPGAVLQAHKIAHAGGGRNAALVLGHGDLFRITGAEPDADLTLDFPRNTTVYAAVSAGIMAYDTPYTKIGDQVGLEHDARIAKQHGFDGKCCIHPSHLEIVKRRLSPSAEELIWARHVEDARSNGKLNRLIEKLEFDEAEGGEKKKRVNDGMGIVDGQLIGPPHIKAAHRILRLAGEPAAPDVAEMITGRVMGQSIDREVKEGQILPNPYELTITPGMRDLWMKEFYSHDPINTSSLFAEECGLVREGGLPSPYMMSLYLCVTMSSTHGAIYHLGFRNAKQHAAIQVGDTVHQRITLKCVRNTSDQSRAVITTHRELIRSSDQVVLFTVDKLELYPVQNANIGESSAVHDFSAKVEYNPDSFAFRVIECSGLALERLNSYPERGEPDRRIVRGDLLYHSFARPLGVAPNLELSTLFLVTHPIHLDHHRYDHGNAEGIVVSGGLVISLVLGSVARDVSGIVWEELLYANNIQPVYPMDTISAISYVIDREDIEGQPHLECLVIKSLGIKNLTPSVDLVDVQLPLKLFEPRARGVMPYNRICAQYGVNGLEDRIVADVVRRVVREKK